ncbi:hypothetical protein BKI49_00250 [Streptomyces sp. Tue6028]|uniref:hypothetical protein n=1 Tax=Streptomyces sp. Tue6028 TaxID=2036037 RepID=UPI000BB338F5|nr:hypothetical protein [Streptomyces sp. Tue6028]PBC65736.1 hypothetical protein BKI49_00250 [Streptomyces sp. Tue6028]
MTATALLDRWGVRIAEWAAPGESALAAQTARTYAAGGAPRRGLFSGGRPAPGGMGGGTVSVLPDVLDALAYAADALKSALGSPQLSNVLSVSGLVIGLRAQRSAGASPDNGTDPPRPAPADDGGARTDGEPEPEEPESLPRASGASASDSPAGAAADSRPGDPASSGTAPRPTPSPAPAVEAVRAALRMSERLRARGMDPAAADELAAEVTARLLAEGEPDETAAFLDALVGEEPPRPTSRGIRPRLRRLISAAPGLRSRTRRPRAGADPRPPQDPDGAGRG